MSKAHLQRRLNGCRDQSYWEWLRKLNILSLQRRRERYSIIHVWNILNGLAPSNLEFELGLEQIFLPSAVSRKAQMSVRADYVSPFEYIYPGYSTHCRLINAMYAHWKASNLDLACFLSSFRIQCQNVRTSSWDIVQEMSDFRVKRAYQGLIERGDIRKQQGRLVWVCGY